MKNLSKIFLTGLAALLPVLITLYVLLWFGRTAESVFGGIIKFALPDSWYYPGMGLLVGLVVIFLIGLLMRAWVVRRLFGFGERLLQRIPLVKTIYGSMRDLMGFFSGSKDQGFSQVVLVTIPGGAGKLMGFVTRDDFSDLPAGVGGADTVAVYLPMGFMIGGYTLLLPRSAIEPIDMSVQDAMKFAVTGGMKIKRPDGDSADG